MSDNNNSEYVEVISEDNKLRIFQGEKASFDIQVSTAKQYPRNIKRCIDNAIAIVSMSQEIAESCTFSVPRGGKILSGPSVNLARILAQTWGNMRIQNKVVDIDHKHITCEGMCWDLESNLAIQTQVKRLIIGKTGRFNEDMITITGNAGNAIALRNAVFSVIPKQIVDTVHNAAKKKVIGDVSDATKLMIRRKEIVEGLIQVFGVTEQEVLKAVGKESISVLSKDDLVVLSGIGTALKEGDITVENAFRGGNKNEIVPETDKKEERIIALIKGSKDVAGLEKLVANVKTNEARIEYDKKFEELKTKK